MAQRFLLQAERDMEFAGLLMQPRGYYLAANLAHQAAEKSLKAACWLVRGEEPPWKHGLEAMAELLVESPEDIPEQVYRAISLLNPIFELTRYPSGNVNEPIPSDAIGEDVARDAVTAAREVIRWVEVRLQEPRK